MFKLLNKKKKDNKGFTLVELVIVIAILAILVGLLAPQYTKYVEKSRKSGDVDNMEEMIKAVQVYAVDHAVASAKGTDGKGTTTDITIAMSNDAEVAITNGYEKALEEYVPNYKKVRLKSNQWGKKTVTVTLTIDSEGGVKVKEYDPSAFGTYSENGSVPAATSTTNDDSNNEEEN